MKIRNVKFSEENLKNTLKENISLIAMAGLTATLLGGSAVYYLNETQTQVESTMENADIYTTEDGQVCGYFEPYEHEIRVKRNDIFPHKMEKHDGYQILDVSTESWRDHLEVVYVNAEPVVAELTGKNGGDELKFADFGTVVSEKPKELLKSK